MSLNNFILNCEKENKELEKNLNYFKNRSERLQQRIDKAIELAYQYAQIDGNHHKMWVIDQMVRELLEKDYDKWIKNYENDGEYSWDTGITP